MAVDSINCVPGRTELAGGIPSRRRPAIDRISGSKGMVQAAWDDWNPARLSLCGVPVIE